jgi:hypothetical protein
VVSGAGHTSQSAITISISASTSIYCNTIEVRYFCNVRIIHKKKKGERGKVPKVECLSLFF